MGMLEPLGVKPEAAGSRKDLALQNNPHVGTGGMSTGCYDGPLNAKTPRPVPIGVYTGADGFGGGTYGARLRDAQGNLFMLSNNHVFAGNNMAPIGAKAIQPYRQAKNWSPTDSVGTLFDFEPLAFFEGNSNGPLLNPASLPVNVIDAAVVATTSATAGNATPCDGYGIPKSLAMSPRHGPVQKYGRTTGLTKGNVTAINATVDVVFGVLPNGNWKVARFVNQIVIKRPGFCDGGDSGALVVNKDGNPMGLLFAGRNAYCIANPILPILSRFGMTVDGI
jgi:hypothetical protein